MTIITTIAEIIMMTTEDIITAIAAIITAPQETEATAADLHILQAVLHPVQAAIQAQEQDDTDKSTYSLTKAQSYF